MERVEKWVHETFAPVVLTCTTSEVERLAQKNNLPFADLLNGFSMLQNADAPLRSVSHSTTLASVNFRFLSSSQFAALPIADSMRLLNEVVMRHPPTPTSADKVVDLDLPSLATVEDVPVFLRVVGANNNTEPLPWYREFKRALMDTFRCAEYTMMGQPAALLLVVSSTESNPRASFEQLSQPQHLPPVFAQGIYDPNLPKFYLVLHDVAETDGTSIDPEAILRNLHIPPNAGAVLQFNSLRVDAPTNANASRWTAHPYVRPALFADANAANYTYLTEHVCGFQSSQDLGRMESFVRDFGLKFVLPAMEARIFQLNEIVTATKKGVKNVFKSWLRKPKELAVRTPQLTGNSTTTAVPGAVTYRYDSIEAQMRLLADTAFMVRDYDLALQTYRLARDDFKSDKAFYHCADANEMIALCLLLTKGSPVQMTNALEAASACYYKVTNPATCRLAVKASVLAGEIYITLSHMGLFTDYMDNASASLIRGSTMEQGICSAVLMERAAMCDLQARQPKFRKFGFRMVMAGHVYDSLGHSAHSARCYALARAVYDASGWFQVEDHINFTLAQQSNRLNDPMASINLFLKLIGTGRNSASQQEALLYEFGMIVKEFLSSGGLASTSKSGPVSVKVIGDPSSVSASTKLVVRDLCMPELDDKSTVVFAPMNAVGINREIDGNGADSDAWKDLERVLEKQTLIHRQATQAPTPKDIRVQGNRWFAPVQMPYRGKRVAATMKKPKQYAVDEKIYVEFEMKNALSCAVDVESIHLYGKFEPKNGSGAFDVPEVDTFGQGDDSRIAVDRVNLQLLPVSEERVRIAVCPKVPGTLRITGVRWSICGGDVLGEHAFSIPGPLLQDTRANKEARARAPNVTLIADVVGHMPWLGVTVEPAPPLSTAEIFVGEVVRYNISFFNAGTADLGHMQLCCTDLALCVAGSDDANALASYIGVSGQVIDLAHIALHPGERKDLVLWARSSRPGKLQPRLYFKYKRLVPGEDPERALARTVNFKLELNVLPCVAVTHTIEPSYVTSGEYILGLTVNNSRPRRPQQESGESLVNLEGLSCVSRHWRVVPFVDASHRSQAVRAATQLDAQESSTSYFRVLRVDVASAEDAVFPPPVALGSLGVDSSFSLPSQQFLCLDNALEMVRAGDASSGDRGSGAGDRSAGGGGGLRSIQSVRRENKALKGTEQDKNGAEANGVAKPDPQPTTPAALLDAIDVDAHLIVTWSAPKASPAVASLNAIGQTNLTGIKLRSPAKSSACPLTITLAYADSVPLRSVPSHKTLQFAELEIIMTVRNDSALSSRPIDFTLELLHPEEAKPLPSAKTSAPPFNTATALAPAPHFFWSGLTKKKLTQFAPNAQAQFQLKACFMSAGVFNLNRFRFVVSPSTSAGSDEAAVVPGVFVFPVKYLVNVHASSDQSPGLIAATSHP